MVEDFMAGNLVSQLPYLLWGVEQLLLLDVGVALYLLEKEGVTWPLQDE